MEIKKNKMKALAFVLYLFLGAAGFLFASNRLYVPVYDVVEGTVQGEHAVLCSENLPEACGGEPVFLYKAREESVEKIENFQMQKNRIQFEENTAFADGTTVTLEIPTRKVTVLWSIFRKGGAL